MKKRLLEVLKRERYGIKDLAKWLDVTYQTAYNKVNAITAWTYDDLLKLSKVIGKKNLDYIFFS